MKNLFVKYGWPDKFRGAEFEINRREWQKEYKRLEDAIKSFRRPSEREAWTRAWEAMSKFLDDTGNEEQSWGSVVWTDISRSLVVITVGTCDSII
jgi:hypothetical protein